MSLANEPRHALNAVCPYFTMFPLEFPLRALRGSNTKRDIVLDPFCGRGTSNYAARYKGLPSYGVDSSPVAVAIARAKLAVAAKEDVLELVEELLSTKIRIQQPQGPFWSAAFHHDTLRQLCLLRKGLKERRSGRAHLLRGVVLGCLHGPQSKDPSQAGYFSNQMPRTFASKPDYSVRYWKKHNLHARNVDVREPIKRKLERVLACSMRTPNILGAICYGDSTEAQSFRHVPDRVSHVITSPPYYGLVTYVEDQWLRNWFVGGSSSIRYSNGVQLSHRSPEDFAQSLAQVWNHCGRRLRSDGKMVIRFGSIKSRDRDAREILKRSLELASDQWRITHTHDVGTASSGNRQADSMGAESKPANEYDFTVRPA